MAHTDSAYIKLHSYIFGVLDIEFLFQLNSVVFPYTEKQNQEEGKEVLILLCIIYPKKKIMHGGGRLICPFTNILSWKEMHEI